MTPTALFSASSERNELEQTSSASASVLVRLGAALRPHLVQDDGDAGARDLPGGLGAGEAAADDMDGFHGPLVTKRGGLVNRGEAQKKTPAGGRIRRALMTQGRRAIGRISAFGFPALFRLGQATSD